MIIAVNLEIIMLEKPIQDFNHKSYTQEEAIELIKDYDRKGFNIYVGTDSQIVKRKISIVTCVCLWKESGGSKIFLMKERIKKKNYPSLWARMELEALRSLELAYELEQFVRGPITVHLDVGTDIEVSKSAAYAKPLYAMVRGSGYKCEIKPDSWAASAVADRWAKS
jgi:predicted RNase H-related nuclease YkuK (DUF458 family)